MSIALRLFPVAFLLATSLVAAPKSAPKSSRPNILVILADQWRAEAFGYAGNRDVKTPNLDALASQSVRFVNAVSGLPVCSPMRASFLTGQRPLTHGVFLNDVPLNPKAVTIGKILSLSGYDTGYIGKWHVNGDGRSSFIPRERRQGFDYWKVLECTHDYNRSFFYGDTPEKQLWPDYDAVAQVHDAQQYLRNREGSSRPFFLVLAWGPPHDPYFTAPEKYRRLYDADQLTLRPNVPESARAEVRRMLAGYYAHCTALDEGIGAIRKTLAETGLSENTVLVFSADHGDMLGSHGLYKKQKPYDESIRVPLLFHWPAGLETRGRNLAAPINSEDLMPTLLGLCAVRIPSGVEGLDFSRYLKGGKPPGDGAAMIMCAAPFGEWDRRHGGKEYRGVRTERYTYVRDLNGPWLLFDNRSDPCQTNNLANMPAQREFQAKLDSLLGKKLRKNHDYFSPAETYIQQWGYRVDANGTVPY